MTKDKLKTIFGIIGVCTIILSIIFTFVFNNGSIMFAGIVALLIEVLLFDLFNRVY